MRVRIIVHGRVQGVGYRASVYPRIAALGVTGYVRNMPDGTVEIVAEGHQSALSDIAEIASEGSIYSSVSGLDTSYSQPTGEFSTFSIAH